MPIDFMVSPWRFGGLRSVLSVWLACGRVLVPACIARVSFEGEPIAADSFHLPCHSSGRVLISVMPSLCFYVRSKRECEEHALHMSKLDFSTGPYRLRQLRSWCGLSCACGCCFWHACSLRSFVRPWLLLRELQRPVALSCVLTSLCAFARAQTRRRS